MSPEHPPEHERSTGAKPFGLYNEALSAEAAHDEAAAAHAVQAMFDTIAPTYDRANHLLSAGIDRYWWTRAARVFRPTLARSEARVLDLCCGTGDMALHLLKHRPKPARSQNSVNLSEGEAAVEGPAVPSAPDPTPILAADFSHQTPGAPSSTTASSSFRVGPASPAPILAIDFSHQMLSRGAAKFQNRPILPIEADALHLPIASGSLDLVTSAFGFRNLANYEEGLAELFRVLGPGGQIGILDCNQPSGLVGALYSLYFKRILPKLGGLVSGTPAAYSYLPASVERFPRPPRMLQLIRAAGFIDATWTSYTLGTAGLYKANKP